MLCRQDLRCKAVKLLRLSKRAGQIRLNTLIVKWAVSVEVGCAAIFFFIINSYMFM